MQPNQPQSRYSPNAPQPQPRQPKPERQYPQYQPSVPPPVHKRSLWDKTWKDKQGNLVLWQRPNAFLIAWAVLTTISLLFTRRPADIISAIAAGALIVWCLLEIFKGTNYFRRLLGLAVLSYAVAVIVRSV